MIILVSCGGSSNKNVAGTGRGEDGIMVQREDDDFLFCYLSRGNIQDLRARYTAAKKHVE